MKELVFEIVAGIIILALLVVFIGVFRGNMDIIASTAGKTEEIEKVKAQSVSMVEDKKEVTGADVVSAIRYYMENKEVIVRVTIGDKTIIYDGSKKEIDSIAYESKFLASYFYDQGKLKEVWYTKK